MTLEKTVDFDTGRGDRKSNHMHPMPSATVSMMDLFDINGQYGAAAESGMR